MQILTPKGYIDISKLQRGDEVSSFDLTTKKNITNIVEGIKIFSSSNKDDIDMHGKFIFYKINDSIKLYKNQSIYTAKGIIHVQQLQKGDIIYNESGEEILVDSIKKSSGTIWHKLTISGNHSYITKGALLHNASRYWNKQNASANWNSTAPTNWGSASGVADSASYPTTTDDVTFDGAGTGGNASATGNANLDILSLTFTSGYTATVTLNTGVLLRLNGGNFTDNTAHSWVVNGTASMTLNGSPTIASGGNTFPGPVLFFTSSATKTLSADWTITGTLSQGGGSQTVNGFTLTIGGGLTNNTGNFSGTTKFIMNGTGTLTTSASTVANNIDINTSGTITFASSWSYTTGTLKYVTGTIAQSGSIIISGSGATACTLDLNGVTIFAMTISTSASATLVISSSLVVTTLTLNTGNNGVIGGTSGFTATTLIISSVANMSFIYTNTYTVTDTFTALAGSSSGRPTISSSDGTQRVNLILQNARTVCNVTCNFTRVVADPARPIISFNGTITDCINVFAYTNIAYKPVTTFRRLSRRSNLTDRSGTVTYQQ